MDILGHSQIAVTMNIYGHVMPAMQQAAGQIDAALGGLDLAPRKTPSQRESVAVNVAVNEIKKRHWPSAWRVVRPGRRWCARKDSNLRPAD
jgi:hypothetical protein